MPKRIQRKRTKGWRMPPGARCCTRPGIFGNPFYSAEAFDAWLKLGEIYLSDLRDTSFFPWTSSSRLRIDAKRKRILDNLHTLKNLDLCCYCGLDDACHVDTLLELANKE